jgi:hypothetical protein
MTAVRVGRADSCPDSAYDACVTARMGWCSLLASLTFGCGGATRETVEDPGPPHEGWGLYELTIERVSDDCNPPLVEGWIGRVMVVVRSPIANIPLYETANGSLAPARTDVSFDEPQSFDVPLAAQPDCSFTNRHIEISVPLANADKLDVAYEQSLSGTATCPPNFGGGRDCSSRRIFHFRWLNACQSGDVTECVEP